MIQNRSCVNGILAAVLSASIVPIHGALAKEKAPSTHKTAARKIDHQAAHKANRQEAPRDDAAKPDTGEANPPAPVTQ
jgi:hypothetical protein